MANTTKVDMRRNPYRGIYSEIAEECGLTRQAVRQAIEIYQNPKLCERFAELVEERRRAIRKYETARREGAEV